MTMPTIISEFLALSIGDKIAVVGMHLMGAAIVILWGLLRTEKQKTKSLTRRVASLPKQESENTISTPSRQNKDQSMQKQVKKTTIWDYLLRHVANIIEKIPFYNPSHNQGNNKNHNGLRSHSGDTITGGKKGVNQNRAEPQRRGS